MSKTYWTDIYGRWHNKEIKQPTIPPSNNAYTYTATARLLGLPLDMPSIHKCYNASQSRYSFDRHPNHKYPPTSRDEIQGAIILHLYDLRTLIANRFYFCNLGQPSPASLWTKLKLLWSIRKAHRNAIWGMPELWGISFTLPRQDQYFVYRLLPGNPGASLSAWFLISSLLTLHKKDPSGVQILWQKLEYLRQLGHINWLERKLLKRINVCQLMSAYYPKEHPFVERVKNLNP